MNPRLLSLWEIPEAAGRPSHIEALAPVLDELEDPESFLRRLRDLVVDDDEDVREVVGAILRKGHQVDEASDGIGALDRLRAGDRRGSAGALRRRDPHR
jgi:PleD family two-component response regulator